MLNLNANGEALLRVSTDMTTVRPRKCSSACEAMCGRRTSFTANETHFDHRMRDVGDPHWPCARSTVSQTVAPTRHTRDLARSGHATAQQSAPCSLAPVPPPSAQAARRSPPANPKTPRRNRPRRCARSSRCDRALLVVRLSSSNSRFSSRYKVGALTRSPPPRGSYIWAPVRDG